MELPLVNDPTSDSGKRSVTPDRDPPDLLREPEHHRPFWVRVLCFAGAGIFFVLGIVGWLIPVMTGIPFYVAGLALLALASDNARHLINRLERRLPRRLRWALRRGLAGIPSERLRRLVNIPTPEEPGAGSPPARARNVVRSTCSSASLQAPVPTRSSGKISTSTPGEK